MHDAPQGHPDKANQILNENSELKNQWLLNDMKLQNKENECNEILFKLRDENSSLQWELKKRIDREKDLFNENTTWSNEIERQSNEILNWKHEIQFLLNTKEKLETINNKLQNDNHSLLGVKQHNSKTIIQLSKDKENLISQLRELNDNMDNVITPKLLLNEETLSILQNDLHEKVGLIEEYRNKMSNISSELSGKEEENAELRKKVNILREQNTKIIEELNWIYQRDGNILGSWNNFAQVSNWVKEARSIASDIKKDINIGTSTDNVEKTAHTKKNTMNTWTTPADMNMTLSDNFGQLCMTTTTQWNNNNNNNDNNNNNYYQDKRRSKQRNNVIDYNDNEGNVLHTYFLTQ